MREEIEWLLSLEKSNWFANGFQMIKRIKRYLRDDSDEFEIIYRQGDLPICPTKFIKLWPLDSLALNWVQLEQKYVPNWKDKIKKFLFNKDYPETITVRPNDNTIIIADYGINHYEVVEYDNCSWVTEFCFPVKPKKWAYIPEDCLIEAERKNEQ